MFSALSIDKCWDSSNCCTKTSLVKHPLETTLWPHFSGEVARGGSMYFIQFLCLITLGFFIIIWRIPIKFFNYEKKTNLWNFCVMCLLLSKSGIQLSLPSKLWQRPQQLPQPRPLPGHWSFPVLLGLPDSWLTSGVWHSCSVLARPRVVSQVNCWIKLVIRSGEGWSGVFKLKMVLRVWR